MTIDINSQSTVIIIVSAAITLCLVQPVLCLDCYHCKYFGKKDGDDWGCQYNPPPIKYLRECYTNLCLVKYAVERGKVYTSRECSHSNRQLGCSNATFKGEEANSPMRSGTLCVCKDRDGCNNARSSSMPSNLVIISLVFSIIRLFQIPIRT